jgi:hypothetical protein
MSVFYVGDDQMTKPRFRSNAGVIALVVVLGLIGAGCTAESSDSDGALNFYESLDLASPSAAVETLSDAFARNDFMTVWLVLDKQAQFFAGQHINLLQYSNLIRTDAVPDMHAEVSSVFVLADLETYDRWNIFSQIMMIADRNDAYLIDLSGEVTVGGESLVGEDVDVLSTVDGIEGEVRFRVTKSPSGRWRVHQVIVPGGDQDMIPWSVPQP